MGKHMEETTVKAMEVKGAEGVVGIETMELGDQMAEVGVIAMELGDEEEDGNLMYCSTYYCEGV
jgi:hypothetical protein